MLVMIESVHVGRLAEVADLEMDAGAVSVAVLSAAAVVVAA